MYSLSDVTPPVAAATTAVLLPNTGEVSNSLVTLAAAAAVGLLTWGVLYVRANR